MISWNYQMLLMVDNVGLWSQQVH